MTTLNGSCFTTSSLKTSILPFSRKPCSLTLKPLSTIWTHSFQLKPKVTRSTDVSIKAAKTVKTADPGATFLKNPETKTSEDNKLVKDTSVVRRRKKVFRHEKNVKRLNTFTAQRIVLDNYEILQYPLRTEAAVNNIANNNTLVFVVDKRADKKCIRDAAKALFKIKTKKINTSISPDGTKKAFLMLVKEQNASEIAKTLKIF